MRKEFAMSVAAAKKGTPNTTMRRTATAAMAVKSNLAKNTNDNKVINQRIKRAFILKQRMTLRRNGRE